MNIRKIKWSIPILVIVITGAFFAGILDRKPKIEIAKDDKIIFTDKRPSKRPSKTDENVIICVPAAFSSEDGIIGHYSVGTGRQGSTNRQYTTIRLDNKTHFQQATLVKDRQPKQFSDTKRRFRRALCKKGGRYYIEHSKLPVTLNDFARLLKEYDYAWNLDMGTYSYGWYRGECPYRCPFLSFIWL